MGRNTKMKGHHLKDTWTDFNTVYLSTVKVRKAVFNACGRSWESHTRGCSHLCAPPAHHLHWHNNLQHSLHSAAPHSPLALPSFWHCTHLGLSLLCWNVNLLILSHIAHSLESVNQRLVHFSSQFSSVSFEYSYWGTYYPRSFLHTGTALNSHPSLCLT